ncbi:hypothetical protein ACXGQW_05760 [Wenyingzhuangia sp. IMCC45533]
MKTIKFLTIASLALLGFNASVQAQGYIDGFFSEQGALSVTTSYTRGSFDEFYFGKEKKNLDDETPFDEITQDIYDVYAKYEVAADLVAFVNIPFIVADAGGKVDPINGETSVSGIQDIALGLKYRIHEFEFETSDLSILSGLTFGIPGDYEPNGILSIGSGSFNTDFTTGLHLNTEVGFFSTVLASYSYRDDAQGNGDFDVPNAFLATAKIGYASSLFYADAWIDHSNSLSGIDISDADFGGRFPATEVEYTRVGATLYKKFVENFGASVGFGTVLDGRNVGKATTFSAGLTYDIQLL